MIGENFKKQQIVICIHIKAKNCSLIFLTETQPRFENRRGQKTRFGTLNFLGDRTNYKVKDIINIVIKIINLFCIYVFQIDKFINTY
jgi:hypothetical protein